jgi:hypothetical protein
MLAGPVVSQGSSDTIDVASAPNHNHARHPGESMPSPRHYDGLTPAQGAAGQPAKNRKGKTEISGSAQTSKPGSIRVSAEEKLKLYHDDLPRIR